MAVETEVVPCVVAMDINVHVAMDKDIIAIAELAAGFDATLRFRAHLNRTLDDVSIKMADSAVVWAFHNGRACRPQGRACWTQSRPGRGNRRAWAARRTAAAKPAATVFSAIG